MDFYFEADSKKKKEELQILDENGNRVFRVQRMSFDKSSTMFLLNEENKIVAELSFGAFHRAFIKRGERCIATIIRKGFIHKSYQLMGLDWKIQNPNNKNLKITSEHGEIASLHTKETSFGETHILHVEPRYDKITVLAIVLSLT